MTERMKPITRFVSSITKTEGYHTFFREPLGKAILYLLVVSILFAGINSIRIAVGLSNGIDEVVNALATEVPNFEIRDGILIIDARMPIIVEDSPDMLFIIDTSGTLDKTVLDDYDNGIFVSQYGFVDKTDGFEVHSYQFSQFGAFSVTKQDVQAWLPLLKWLNIFIIVFSIIFYFIGKLLSAVIVSIGGLIIESIVKHKVGFTDLMKLSIYALTLPMVLKFLLAVSEVAIPYFWVIYYGIALIYVWKALQLLLMKSEMDTAAEEEAIL